MRTFVFLPTLGMLLTILACTKPGASPAIAVLVEEDSIVPVTTPTVDPYAMLTSDSAAFAEGKATECGVNQSWWRYCGYASAQNGSSQFVALPSFYSINLDSLCELVSK